jgi:two-component system, OmpR family, response regulator
VLIVEDEVPLAETIRRGLAAEGFECDVVHDGAEGLWRANEFRYHAVVLDLLLPSMNGFAVCKQMRQAENWTPVLILTAKDGEYDEAEALDTGADDFLSKPFSFVVLVARLRALVRRGAAARPAVITVGTLSFDPHTRECFRGDTKVALTRREAALLETLMRRSPGVASKHELLEEVWGADFDGDLNVIDLYLGYLRRKIDRPFGVATVETIRGVGHRLVPDV